MARLARTVLVAPFTQLTFVSFDLQMFLYDVLHTTAIARVGHIVGMAGGNLCLMGLAIHGSGSLLGGAGYAGVLVAWYAVVARSVGLRLWWCVMVGVVGLLLVAAWSLVSWGTSVVVLLGGLLGCGALVMLTHAAEPLFPPRAGDPLRWMPMRHFACGPPEDPLARVDVLRRVLKISCYPLIGLLNETWASPRLLPYAVLRVMMAGGYAPRLRSILDGRMHRALASGNPALDYVGIGGGTFIVPPERRSR